MNVSYEYEKVKMRAFWELDERYHKHRIKILYERFSYAMAMVAGQFLKEYNELYKLKEAHKKALTFAVYLSGTLDEIFRHCIGDFDFDDAIIAYYEEDYFDEAYDEFWDRHQKMAGEVNAIRNSFSAEERTFLYGFSGGDAKNETMAEIDTGSRDFLHIMRVCKHAQNMDAEKFLTATKREYSPMIIKFFIAKPKIDIFANKPATSWWRFWKRVRG